MGGTPVFYGTRVSVQTLLDYLEAGESIDDFLTGFPSVSSERVIAFLEELLAEKRNTVKLFEEHRSRADLRAFRRILNRKGGEPPRGGDEKN